MCASMKLIRSQDHYTIEFDVTGGKVSSNFRTHRNKVIGIRYEICGILGLHENLVEITRPTQIPNGLRIHINLYINNAKAIDLNPEMVIINAKRSNQLSMCIKDAWGLTKVPRISNIRYERHESSDRVQNAVVIRLNAVPSNSRNIVNNHNIMEMKPLPFQPRVVFGSTQYGIRHDIIEDSVKDESSDIEDMFKDYSLQKLEGFKKVRHNTTPTDDDGETFNVTFDAMTETRL